MPEIDRVKFTICALAVLAIWVAVIVASGSGWNPFSVSWDFSNTGAFGDSFGPLSSIMAGIAAISAVAAFRAQQQEMQRSKLRDQEQDKRSAIADFEGTFSRLLEHHRAISSSIDIEGSGSPKTGHDAFRAIIYHFERRIQLGHIESWRQTSEKYKNDLGHYFRFLYHLINFVHSKSYINGYFYIRLVRATLSESELLALALNCAWGDGKEKFKPLVEKYALLHNLSTEKVDMYKLRGLFEDTAFDITEIIAGA